jgi:hypothetical protein
MSRDHRGGLSVGREDAAARTRHTPPILGGITLLLGAVTSDVDHAAALRLLYRRKAQPLRDHTGIILLQLFSHTPTDSLALILISSAVCRHVAGVCRLSPSRRLLSLKPKTPASILT